MFEGPAHIDMENNLAVPMEEIAHNLGRTSYIGTYLTGDRVISTDPYVDGEGDGRDYYVGVLGPSQAGRLETSQLPLEAALRAVRFLRS
jgi:hypothetical protein